MRTILLLLFVTVLTAGCKKGQPDITTCEDLSIISVPLGNCNEKASNAANPQLCFEQLIEDSRCPSHAVCVWAGVAVARFQFTVNNSQHQITLATTKLPGRASTDTVVAGHKLALLNIYPYPGTGTGSTHASVRITR